MSNATREMLAAQLEGRVETFQHWCDHRADGDERRCNGGDDCPEGWCEDAEDFEILSEMILELKVYRADPGDSEDTYVKALLTFGGPNVWLVGEPDGTAHLEGWWGGEHLTHDGDGASLECAVDYLRGV